MIHMGLLNIIRRMHLRQKLSIREIARLTGVSRNTVTKHLAANTIEPKFATPERQSKIEPAPAATCCHSTRPETKSQ